MDLTATSSFIVPPEPATLSERPRSFESAVRQNSKKRADLAATLGRPDAGGRKLDQLSGPSDASSENQALPSFPTGTTRRPRG